MTLSFQNETGASKWTNCESKNHRILPPQLTQKLKSPSGRPAT